MLQYNQLKEIQNTTTKQEEIKMKKAYEGFYENYKRATATELSEVYGRYSAAKAQAMEYCKEMQHNMNGYDGRICSANTFQFTYAFKYVNESGRNCLAYITRDHNRYFEID